MTEISTEQEDDMDQMTEPKEPKEFWLDGNFAPIKDETTEFDLEVIGSIPPELNGRYFRNGSNPPFGKSLSWFMGVGMVHGVEIRDGKALWYRNRYVQTELLAEEMPAGPIMMKPENSLANTHVIEHAGKVLALEEGHLPIELSHDLDTVGPYTFDGKLSANMTAHPKICGETGELLFFGYGLFPPFMTYHRASPTGELLQSEEIPVKGSTMVHDFNVTRNYVIFMDLPMVWDMSKILDGGLAVNFEPEYGARLGVMPRSGSAKEIRWFDIEPCYVFHTMNAHEAGDEIVIDVCRIEEFIHDDLAKTPLPRLHQWSINMKTGTVSERKLDDLGVDFPRVPDKLVGQPYRYGYVAEYSEDVPVAIAYHKYDMLSGQKTTHRLENGRTGGEAVFVPAKGATSEDDGYLLSFVHNPEDDKSELVILNASQMENEPIARIRIPVRVPVGFHGSWIASPS